MQAKPTGDRPFTKPELIDATLDLSTVPFFPHEAKVSIMRELAAMCPHHRALRWLAETAVSQCRVWPGLADLRGLLCSRFDAADGRDQPFCGIPGFTPEEQEAKALDTHEALKLDSGLDLKAINRLRKLPAPSSNSSKGVL